MPFVDWLKQHFSTAEIPNTILAACAASFLLWGGILGNGWLLALGGILMRWYLLTYKDRLPQHVLQPLMYLTKYWGISIFLLWMVWLSLNGIVTPLLFFVTGMRLSFLWLHRNSIANGSVHWGHKTLGQDDIILALVLIFTSLLTSVVRSFENHVLYIMLASVALGLFVVLHLRGDHRSRHILGLMTFWGLVVVRGIAAAWFLTKERMHTLEAHTVEKEVIKEKIIYVPMYMRTGQVVNITNYLQHTTK